MKALLFCLLGLSAEALNDVFLSNDLKRSSYRNAFKTLRVNFGSRYKVHFVFLGIVLGVCFVVAYLFYMASLSSQWKAVDINRVFATRQLVCSKGFPFHCKKYNIFGRGFICWTFWGTYSCFYNISDDLIMLSRSKAGLQNCLNALAQYCRSWMSNINKKKQGYYFSTMSEKIWL